MADFIDPEKVIGKLRPWLNKNAAEALVDYTEQPLLYDDPMYPFKQHEDERSIRDADSQNVSQTPHGILITITAAAARFIEYGNAPEDGEAIQGNPFMALKLRPAARKPTGGRIVLGEGGGAYLLREEVEPYDGTNRLRDAVWRAFGVKRK